MFMFMPVLKTVPPNKWAQLGPPIEECLILKCLLIFNKIYHISVEMCLTSGLVSQNYLTFCVAYICADYVG